MFASARTVVTQTSTLAFFIGQPTKPGVPPKRVAARAESVQVLMTAGVDMTDFVQDIEVWRLNNLRFRASLVTTATLLSPSCFALED